ncbi:MAG: hypothetical protein IKK36_11670 [Bacteroidales bacterium]|nr:hypothetical protein [Bacteroidales bacterium]
MEVALTIIDVALLIWGIAITVKYNRLLHEKNDQLLKNRIFPHTIRNKIETFRIKTKHLKKKSDELLELKKMADDLYDEINNVSDFLGDEAYNSDDRVLVPISDEIDMIRNYIKTSCGQNASNIVLHVNVINYDFSLPDRITVSMIENAFKHGDTSAPDFMRIDITEKEKGDYEFVVKNKMRVEDYSGDRKLSGLGVQNMKDRIANYNEYNDEYKGSIYVANKKGYFYFKLLFKKI